MISGQDVVRMLRDCGALTQDPGEAADSPDSPDSAVDEAFVLDSMTLVWLVHLLQEQHGITIGPDDEEELASCTSVSELHRRLTRATSREVAHDA
ncbi:hypothetical protein AB0F18_25730 [Streptomyces sp. NPDC029216]|uniref:hypothetical protein n=1 Tax=Streptomyces sp. NPDC029216 TaxID=3154701 RepID=UPI0033CB45F5